VASGLARGALQVAVSGRQPLPELRALLTGRLVRPDVDAAPTDLDSGVPVGMQVQIPGRGRAAPALEATTTNVSPSARYCTGVLRVHPERRPVVCSKSTG